MIAKNYAAVAGTPKGVAELKGQAKVVWAELEADRTPRLGVDITAEVVRKGNLKTGQDPLRVVLYYIVIFKKNGWVVASEPTPREATVNPWRALEWAPAE